MTRIAAGRAGRRRRGLHRLRPSLRWLTPPLMLLAAGCTTGGPTAAGSNEPAAGRPVSFAGCAGLSTPPTAPTGYRTNGKADKDLKPVERGPAAAERASAAAGGGRAGLPELRLPCFADGQAFQVAGLRGPAVINFWATSCGPCRAELPAVQRLAERTAGRLHVVGVDTADSRDAAASFGTDLGITFPNLFDTDGSLQRLIGAPYLPMTVFVDAAGRREVYNGRPLDDARLAELVTAHTGVTVTP